MTYSLLSVEFYQTHLSGLDSANIANKGNKMSGEDKVVFRKSRHSSDGHCVEIGSLDGYVLVRDSKDERGPVLTFSHVEWLAFLAGVRDGEFDLH